MRIVGVIVPGAPACIDEHIDHGVDPKILLWRAGYVVRRLLSARLEAGEIVVTALVSHKRPGSRPPKVKKRGSSADLIIAPGETPVVRQRVAAYAIVRSKLGVLATQFSDKTAVPGLWQLPGGGLEKGETPAEGVIREIAEETDQKVELDRLLDVQSDHWIGRSPSGQLEDFQALRIIYAAICLEPTTPQVLDVGGTTETASWVPTRRWRRLPWTSGARSLLERHLDGIRLPKQLFRNR